MEQITSEQIQERADEIEKDAYEYFMKYDNTLDSDIISYLSSKLAELELKIESLKKE